LHGISLSRLVELMFQYLTQAAGLAATIVGPTLWRDYQRGGRSDKPACLRPFAAEVNDLAKSTTTSTSPKRQSRRLGLVNEAQP
jgi:hypothetical protein